MIRFHPVDDRDTDLYDWLDARRDQLDLQACGADLWFMIHPVTTLEEARQAINFLLDYAKKLVVFSGPRLYFEYTGVRLHAQQTEGFLSTLTGALGSEEDQEDQSSWDNADEEEEEDEEEESAESILSANMPTFTEMEELDFDDPTST